jgi:transposase-like protein
LEKSVQHRQAKYLNHRLGADHGALRSGHKTGSHFWLDRL